MGSETPSCTVRTPDVAPRALLIPPLARTLLWGVGLLVVCSLAAAPTWIGPRRPLSEDEKLALTVSQADAIVIARVMQSRDSTLEGPPLVEGGPVGRLPYKDVTLLPSRWLKGGANPGQVHVGLIDRMDVVWDDIARLARTGEPIVGVFFLRRVPDRWMISDYPAGYNKGHLVRLDKPTDETPETRAVEAMVARQSLDSLLIRADLVILGYRRPLSPCVRVDSVLAGCAPADTIHVDSPVAMAVDPGPAVFFLRRVAPNQFETVDFRAGSIPVSADTLVRLGIPLRQVFRRAAELRARRTEHEWARP